MIICSPAWRFQRVCCSTLCSPPLLWSIIFSCFWETGLPSGVAAPEQLHPHWKPVIWTMFVCTMHLKHVHGTDGDGAWYCVHACTRSGLHGTLLVTYPIGQTRRRRSRILVGPTFPLSSGVWGDSANNPLVNAF